MRAASLLLAAVLVLVLSACSSAGSSSANKFSGTAKDVATVVEDLQSAAQDDDASRACTNLFARSLVTQLQQRGIACQRAVARAFDAVDTTDLKVTSVRVNGANATTRVESGTGDSTRTFTVRLVREGRNWKIASL